MQDKYSMDVIALVADLGENKDLQAIKAKALSVGACKCRVVDVKETFLVNFAFKVLKANALYEGNGCRR